MLPDHDLIQCGTVYGWRSADAGNFAKLQNGKLRVDSYSRKYPNSSYLADFPDVTQIMLEQNYRSAGSILAASVAIVSRGELPGRI